MFILFSFYVNSLVINQTILPYPSPLPQRVLAIIWAWQQASQLAWRFTWQLASLQRELGQNCFLLRLIRRIRWCFFRPMLWRRHWREWRWLGRGRRQVLRWWIRQWWLLLGRRARMLRSWLQVVPFRPWFNIYNKIFNYFLKPFQSSCPIHQKWTLRTLYDQSEIS